MRTTYPGSSNWSCNPKKLVRVRARNTEDNFQAFGDGVNNATIGVNAIGSLAEEAGLLCPLLNHECHCLELL